MERLFTPCLILIEILLGDTCGWGRSAFTAKMNEMATTKFPFWLKCLHYNRGGAVVTCPVSTGRGWLQPRLAKSNFPGEWSWLWLDGGWKGLSRLYLRILRAAAPGLQKTLWAADTGNLVFLSVSVSAQSSLFTNLPSISSTILIKYLNTTWYPHQWQPGTPRHS